MAVPVGLMQMAFAAGLDESQHDEVLDPMSAFPVLQNGRQDKRGGYSKRLGYAALAATRLDATTRTAGLRLLTNGDQVCTIDGTYLDVYSETPARSVVRSRVPEATYRLLEAPSLGANSVLSDTACVNGYVALAWNTPNPYDYVHAALLDAATGAVIVAATQLGTATNASIDGVRLGTYGVYVMAFLFIYSGTGASTITSWYLDTTSPATINTGWQAGPTITDYAGDPNRTNLAVASLSGSIAVAFESAASVGTAITVKRMTIGGVAETVNVVCAAPGPEALDLAEGGTVLWLTWAEGTAVKVIGLNPADIDGTALGTVATAFTASGTPQRLYIGPRSSGQGVVFATSSVVNAGYTDSRALAITAGATTTDGDQSTYVAWIVGSPFVREGRIYAPFSGTYSGDSYTDVILCDCTPAGVSAAVPRYLRPVAVPIQRGLFSSGGQRTAVSSSTKYLWGLVVRKSGTTTGTSLVEYDFASAYRWKPATLNGSTFLGGGVTSVFDGTRVFEAAFLVAPGKPLTDSTTGSGLTLTYGRKYVAIYEEVDADGNWHTSGVSEPSAISGAMANKAVTVSVVPIAITSRGSASGLYGSALRVALYATSDGGEEPYYRLDTVANVPSAMLTYSDTVTESDLELGALLYGTGKLPGTGGSQDHRAPPGLLHIASYNGMVAGTSGTTVFFSAQSIDGEGAWFSPVFTVDVDEDATGLAVQDGSLVIFTRTSCYSVSGDPPSDNGASGGLSVPRRISADLGCINANSIVATALGVFFQSHRGIELLTRGGSVEWIGEKVQTTLDSYPVITSAVLDARNALVRFSLAASTTAGVVSGNGRDLIYDLSLRTWISVDDKTGAGAHEASQDAASVYVGGVWRYGWLSASGIVYYERLSTDASAHLDGTTWVTMAAETASFKASGIQGRQVLNRVLVMARKATDFNLSISLSYNHETSFRTARLVTHSVISALLSAGYPITQLRHDAHDDAECQAFRVRLEDATPTSGTVGSGKGAMWLALTLDVTPKPGAFEVPEEAA